MDLAPWAAKWRGTLPPPATTGLALQQLASDRFPLDLITTHRFGLKDTDLAIKSVGGMGEDGVIHVSLLPWK